MYITNLTLYDDVAPGRGCGRDTEAASGYDAVTVGVAAGVPTLLLVISLVAHLTRVLERARQLVDSIRQLFVSLQTCVKGPRGESTNVESAPVATPPIAESLPMRNLTDSAMMAMRSSSHTDWI